MRSDFGGGDAPLALTLFQPKESGAVQNLDWRKIGFVGCRNNCIY
jgi:hypothetical protein